MILPTYCNSEDKVRVFYAIKCVLTNKLEVIFILLHQIRQIIRAYRQESNKKRGGGDGLIKYVDMYYMTFIKVSSSNVCKSVDILYQQ